MQNIIKKLPHNTQETIAEILSLFDKVDKVIKQACPEAYKKALKIIGEGLHPSNMTDFAIRILAQGSELGKKMLPINTALKIALEKTGYILSLTENPPENPKPKAA
jgi:hypothetical protein